MPQPNIKTYLILSGVLLFLFLAVIFIPFGKKQSGQQEDKKNYPTPTTVKTDVNFGDEPLPTPEAAQFTGAAEEELPPDVLNAATQKQNLRIQVPIDFGIFALDFDYDKDKFVVTLIEPKDQSLSSFNEWKKNNYPDIADSQFIIK